MEAKFLLCIALCIFGFLQVGAKQRAVQIDRLVNTTHFQGDIVMTHKQRNGILKAQRWPNGVIPYQHEERWTRDQLSMIDEAMRAIQASTCIRFVKRTNEKDYIFLRRLGGCFSNVGRVGGAQVLSLMHTDGGATCFTHKTIVHELLHAVGLWHEQSRYDRDQYVTIKWDNIYPSVKYNFDLYTAKETDTYGIPYNYRSAMHYSAYAFTYNGDITMQPVDEAYTDIIGNVAYGHELDWEKVRRIYECKGTYTPAPTTAAPTTPAAMCSDQISYCDTLVADGRCEREANMRTYCRKSCGFCKPGQLSCQDKVDYCKGYKKECGYATWLNEYCEKTCKLC